MDHNTANSRLTNTDKSLTKLRSSITLLASVLCSTELLYLSRPCSSMDHSLSVLTTDKSAVLLGSYCTMHMRKNLAKLKNMIRIGWNYTYTHTHGRSSRELPFERTPHRFNIVQLQRGGEGGCAADITRQLRVGSQEQGFQSFQKK